MRRGIGAVVERIEHESVNSSHHITIAFSESIEAASIAGGVGITAHTTDGTLLRTLTIPPTLIEAGRALRFEVSDTDWTAFATGAAKIEIAVTPTLRFAGWGATPLQPAAEWETLLGRATSSADLPFIKTIAPGEFAGNGVLYDLPDLYLAARLESRAKLLFDFHTLPLRDPATSFTYVRARWYDASTASFLTPDPMGYEDASNLYAGFANDPINYRDPEGTYVETAIDIVSFIAGIDSISRWDENTTGWEKALDVGGVVLDAVAIALPVIPGGASVAVKALKAASRGADAALGVRWGAKAVDTAHDAVKFVNAADIAADTRRAFQQADKAKDLSGISAKARRASTTRRADDMADTQRLGPCPVRPKPLCVAAGTLIATPNEGAVPIEELRVGDRVATTNINPELPDGSTTVDSINWHLVKLHMSNPSDLGDVYEIQTLRPIEWILEHDAFPGRTIEFETERSPIDHAYVVSVEKAQAVARGSGRVVLSTFTHRDQILTIRFEGVEESLDTTASHRLYSVDRGAWTLTSSLRVGDRVRTSKGEAKIAALEPREIARVFDIEVETDHAYFIDGADVLSHNCGDADEMRRLRAALGEGPETSAMRVVTPTRNLASTPDTSYLYAIRVDGNLRKVGISSVAPNDAGDLVRARTQVRRLERQYPGAGRVRYEVRRTFANREDALRYEKKLLERYKRRFGHYPGEGLPGGNKINR